MNILGIIALATGEAAAEAPAGGFEQIISMVFTFALIIGVFYLMIIRPQRKKDKALRELVAALKVGDEVLTIGGIYGKVVSIKDDTLTIESAPGNEKSKFKIARWAVKECLTVRDEG